MSNISTLGSFADNSGSSLTFRNRVINGDMKIDQRFAGSKYNPSVGGTLYYTGLDVWQTYFSTGSLMSHQRLALTSSDLPYQLGFRFYSRVNRESGAGFANENVFLSHAMEGYQVGDFNFGDSSAKQFTISFFARASGSYNFCLTLCNAKSGTTRTYLIPFSVTTSWQKFSFTVTADTTGTWASDNTLGLQLRFSLGGGAFSSTTNSWKGDNLYTLTGQTQMQALATNSYFDITGVQVELGALATPFEFKSYGTDLHLCQRYYEKSHGIAVVPGTDSLSVAQAGAYAVSSATPEICFYWKVQKRVDTPNVTVQSPLTTSSANKVRKASDGTIYSISGLTAFSNSAVFTVTSGTASVTYQLGWTAEADI